MGQDLAGLLESGQGADVTFQVEEETMRAHRIILTTRSPMFQGMLNSGMREGADGVVVVEGEGNRRRRRMRRVWGVLRLGVRD